MTYLLDTCILSEGAAKQPNPNVIHWLSTQPMETLYLSTISIGEISKGIRRMPESQRKTNLEVWLYQELLTRFEHRVLAPDVEIMLAWGDLVSKLEAQGRSLPIFDSLIAATALYWKLNLVTRNEKDFDKTGITIVNPFSSPT
jgi:toxin FitB